MSDFNTFEELKCNHLCRVPRKRKISNGTIAVYNQCVNCGSGGNALKLSGFNVNNLEWFDETLHEKFYENYKNKIKEKQNQITIEIDKKRQEYNEYLQSLEWKQRRELVLKRSNFLCEGCLKNRASEVHHKNYDHVKNELLFDLVALCSECHRKVHGK